MAKKAKQASRSALIEQDYQLVPLDSIKPHPRNVNSGDLGALIESVKANGFSGALLVQKSTGYIIAGNHSWRAAHELGMERVPVIFIDCDDDSAIRRMLADNRVTRLGYDNQEALADLLQSIMNDSGSLSGTGYDGDDLDALLADLANASLAEDADPDEEPAADSQPDETKICACPQCGHKFSVLISKQ